MKRLYLDACILIAYFSISPEEIEKKRLVLQCLDVFAQLDNVELCTSHWAFTEAINILISRHKMDTGEVAKIEADFMNKRRLQKLKVKILDMSSDKSYDFQELCYAVREKILSYHAGVGDCFHVVIMENNNVVNVLTFDEKNDFKQIPGLTVFHPRDITL